MTYLNNRDFNARLQREAMMLRRLFALIVAGLVALVAWSCGAI